jgi:hypothetical protein
VRSRLHVSIARLSFLFAAGSAQPSGLLFL